MIEKQADTQVPITALIASRWSGRVYDPKRKIEREPLLAMLEAARWAPSCYGDEPWRFIVCDRHTNDEAWQHALDCLSEGNRQWAQHAPVLILALADTLLSRNNRENRWGAYDTGAASISLCLQAKALGLMSHQMGGFDTDKARHLFAVPGQYNLMTVIAVGYQQAKEQIPDNMLAREMTERQRKPLNEHFFAGCWGKKIS